MAGSKGSVILLFGPSCAGKTSLATAIQALSPQPYVAQSLDALFAATPEGWGSKGERARDGFRYEWEGPDVRRIVYGSVGWALLQGFHRAVAAYAEAGVSVVVDDMLLDLDVLADWARALASVPTLLVNVTAPRDELLRREAARQAHATPGLVAGHFDLHQAIAADARVDTATLSPAAAASSILDLASSPSGKTALQAFRIA